MYLPIAAGKVLREKKFPEYVIPEWTVDIVKSLSNASIKQIS